MPRICILGPDITQSSYQVFHPAKIQKEDIYQDISSCNEFGTTANADLTYFASPSVSPVWAERVRSEEHTSELQSLMRISSDDFCLKKKNQQLTIKWLITH